MQMETLVQNTMSQFNTVETWTVMDIGGVCAQRTRRTYDKEKLGFFATIRNILALNTPWGSVYPARALRAPCAHLERHFYYDFSRFNPQVHHYPIKPPGGECDDGRVGERPRTRLPSTRGSKGTSGEMSIVGIDGDGGGDSRLGIQKEMESMGHQ